MMPSKIYYEIVSGKQQFNPFGSFDHREFLCGWGAAGINIFLTFPIYKMIFRQMLHGVKIKAAFDQLHSEGLTFLYRGIGPPLLQKTLSLSVMFGVYDGVKRPAIEYYHINEYSAKCIGGIVSGSFEAILMPFERVQTILADSAYHNRYKNTYHAFTMIRSEFGWRELYRGLVPILIRNGPSNAMFFLLREEANKLPHKEGILYSNVHQFASGAIIGAFTSSVFYPFNVVKVVIQSKLGGSYESWLVVLKETYIKRGRSIRNVYKGLNMNCLRAAISWGIMNSAYENLRHIFY